LTGAKQWNDLNGKPQSAPRKCEAKKTKTRNPKFETNPNDQKAQNSKQTRFGFRFLDFDLTAAVCFGFRASDFGF
jgi:hypothetical protein